MTQCMLDACVLAVTLAGLLLIVRAITIEQVLKSVLRVLVGFIAAWFAVCILNGLLVGFVSPLLWWLAKCLFLALIILLLILALLLVTDIAVGRGKKEEERGND